MVDSCSRYVLIDVPKQGQWTRANFTTEIEQIFDSETGSYAHSHFCKISSRDYRKVQKKQQTITNIWPFQKKVVVLQSIWQIRGIRNLTAIFIQFLHI